MHSRLHDHSLLAQLDVQHSDMSQWCPNYGCGPVIQDRMQVGASDLRQDVGRVMKWRLVITAQQFYQYMINKFHKTAYPRQHNLNVVSSSQGKRTPLYAQTTSESINPQKRQIPIERKIDIESSLLFTHKNYPKTVNKLNQPNPRKTTNQSQAKFYETSIGFTQSKNRPESKQQPRVKMLNEGKLKTQIFQHQRPQTSKGQRQIKPQVSSEVRQRQSSEQEEQVPFQIKVTTKKTRNVQSSYSKRLASFEVQLPFNTSIDPEFLSLFAN